MNLAEFQKKFGIRRIDFDRVHRTDLDEEYGDDKLVCPYCGEEIEYESEDIDDVLHGTSWMRPACEKWFYAEGEATINVTCTPMEDAVIDNRRHIESTYRYIDECEKRGMNFPDNLYGNAEWEVYNKFAQPLFENMKQEDGS